MIIRGDDTDAFGQSELLRINYTVPEGQVVSKAILDVNDGLLKLPFNNPINPIEINLNSEQTAILKDNNCCTLILYDGNNKKLTIPCIAEFKSKEGVKV